MNQREYETDVDNLSALVDEMRDLIRHELEGRSPDEIIVDPGPLKRLIGKASAGWRLMTGIEHALGLSRATRRT